MYLPQAGCNNHSVGNLQYSQSCLKCHNNLQIVKQFLCSSKFNLIILLLLQGTFMFISTVVCLVPVVDCSEAVGVVEMTEVFLDTKCK